ncbi:type I polyketide synthase [Bifidobacterium choloepi]|uniref:type I polyketide synthase n=1 Tax=Bifidobacterium choloepi TaxID=2614131 RepID=UPI001E35079A|nr:type I polyketide synthase [Bifidobacterium choloepi]
MAQPKFFFDSLAQRPHALMFAGQSTPWTTALADELQDPLVADQLHSYADAARALLTPVAGDLLATTGRAVDLFGFAPNPARLGAAADATVSVGGIALAQLGALLEARELGYDIAAARPAALLGHSQGILGVHMAQELIDASQTPSSEEVAETSEAKSKRGESPLEGDGTSVAGDSPRLASGSPTPSEEGVERIADILAIAQLIGAAGTREARNLGLVAKVGDATPMLSVKGATPAQVAALIDRVDKPRGPISVAVVNSPTHVVLSGYPQDLAAFAVEATKEHKHQAQLRADKVRGGSVFDPTLEYLEVTLPFHSPLMEPAVEQTVMWAAACGLDTDRARVLASEVLVNQVDWDAQVRSLLADVEKSDDSSGNAASSPLGDLWLVDLGPSATLSKLVSTVAEGTGIGLADATTSKNRAALAVATEPANTAANFESRAHYSTPSSEGVGEAKPSRGESPLEGDITDKAVSAAGAADSPRNSFGISTPSEEGVGAKQLTKLQDWSRFAPRVIETPAGRKLDTKFTRLTGKPPVLLAGMTPTTVEPELVAAAANAGYWAELAGGGQVTADVFDRHMDALEEQLEEGRTIEFNAMFMDRYLWNLQFGSQRIVSKKRESGAPIDGVVVSAGIPELDEARDLIRQLNDDGFPYVAFKPGTVEQIRQVVRIARAVAPTTILMQVEGGSAGGHHSWESLDDLLLTTYADVREQDNLVLVAGGGIGTPERAADYISGEWARAYDRPAMPVDGVLVGTAVMTAKEAHTSPEVKQLLVETQGFGSDAAGAANSPRNRSAVSTPSEEGVEEVDVFAPLGERWVPALGSVGGVASGLSHLHADIYELENSSARCGRLLVHVMKHPEELEARRDEIIEALNATAKPYFGDLADMTYGQWADRFAELAFPWVDETYADRFLHLLQRIEARVVDQESGEFTPLFGRREDVEHDPSAAIALLRATYPVVDELKIVPVDEAWFTTLVREYPKPMPFVPAIDHDLLRWWGQDQLWQSEDPRYSADSVRIIPGPISVAGITTVDEPVADILGRFEAAMVNRASLTPSSEGVGEAKPSRGESPLEGDASDQAGSAAVATDSPRNRSAVSTPSEEGVREVAFAMLGDAKDPADFIRKSPHISWVGHLMDNPAYGSGDDETNYELKTVDDDPLKFDLDIHLDTFWDNDPDGGTSKHAVRDIVIPLNVAEDPTGFVPVVDRERLPEHVCRMLADTAGIGNTAITGDKLTAMPEIDLTGDTEAFPFGVAHASYTLSANLGADHEAATGRAISQVAKNGELIDARIVPDALVGPAWPAIYAALGSVYVDGYPVIEGLLNAVHLDHLIELEVDDDELLAHVGETVALTSWAEPYFESASGRVVTIHVEHRAADGTLLARETERFAIRGRAYSKELPAPAADYGDVVEFKREAGEPVEIVSTPRRLIRRVRVAAPHEMTAFARTSGDFNPIHTSARGAAISGLFQPLVHGMWLSATAQHAVQAMDDKGMHYEIEGWTYNMYGMVQLDDVVDISVERIGRVAHGGLVLEVTCRIDGNIVSRATAITRAPISAFVYPGQGIQQQGMVLDERAQSPAARDVWERADKLTRDKLGFSILAVVRDNPTELTANGVTYRHPEGLLNLTQFTQVALATVAFAQTARLREAGADITPAYFAGHSLGEYNALSSFGRVIPLETVLELVFHRGSTMHHLIDRDEQGRSNYRMGALRPNQFGVDDAHVKEYVASVAEASGEFLEIVNYNLAGQQYAIAGTIAGLKALAADSDRRVAEYGGKKAFMLVPGIDVPFHSTLLRKGVEEFRDKLDALLPQYIDYRGALEGRYIPNLVAVPFEMTKEFARKILDVVPSRRISEALNDSSVWDAYAADDQKLGRLLLTELLSWQFASPVRWIETQALLFGDRAQGGLGVEEYVEVGLGNSPTLANLGTKTLRLPEFAGRNVTVYNVGRDEARVYMTDSDSLVDEDDFEETEVVPTPSSEGVAEPQAKRGESPLEGDGSNKAGSAAGAADSPRNRSAVSTPSEEGVGTQAAAAPTSGAPAGDLPFKAHDAIAMLLAYAAKVRPDQIGGQDTTDTLTNGVSSRRNQLLMDISSELGVASVDGAADASIDALSALVDKVAPNYKAFGPVLSDIVRDRVRGMFGAAGVKLPAIEKRVTETWGLSVDWAHHVVAALVLGTREDASGRGGDLQTLPATSASNASAANELIDAAVQQVAAANGVAVSMASAGGAAGGAVVDSAALDAFAAQVTGETGILANTAKYILGQLGVAAPVVADDEDESSAIVAAVEAELGSDWPQQVAPRFDAAKAILFDDRWATAREDLARAYFNGDLAALGGSFAGAGSAVAAQAKYYAGLAAKNGEEALAARFEDIAREAAGPLAAADAAASTLSQPSADSSLPGSSDGNASGSANATGNKLPGRELASEASLRVDAPAAAGANGSADFRGVVAVVTGVAPNSIAAQVVCGLLAGGATVIATSHSFKPSMKRWAQQAYRTHATADARLWLVPANLSSYRDVDALVEWVGSEQKKTSGATTTVLKPAYEPTLFFPFAAPPVHGTMADSGELFESQARLMLWGVERAIAGLAKIGENTHVQHRLHVVLPGSPNRGIFGGDGAYGEVKSAFDAIVNRAHAEKDWSDRVTFAHPRIGWVRGTGLMGGNDPLVEVVERHGLRTYSTEEIAAELLKLATEDARRQAAEHGPIDADLTGGLGDSPIDIKALRAEAEADAAAASLTPSLEGVAEPQAKRGEFATGLEGEGTSRTSGLANSHRLGFASPIPEEEGVTEASAARAAHADVAIKALPTPHVPAQAAVNLDEWTGVTARPEDEIVIVSIGELGPWGSGRTRFEAELGIEPDGSCKLSAGAVLELAWNMGLVTWQDSPKPGWYDVDGNLVPEEDIAERYHDDVVARSGVRPFETGMGSDYRDGTDEEEAEVYLDHDVTFSVPTKAAADEYVMMDEEHTSVAEDTETGEWLVTRHAGSMIRVPRRAAMTRTVGGQFPDGFDPTRWGIPASMVGDVDEIALWNIVTTVDAYLSAGFTPAEILEAVHPSMVASTQGTGFGGMSSMRKLYLDRFLNHEIPTDILQEALPNVVAAHVMQSYIGGYGNMIQPVSACATAAVSLEEGVDKIALGKADFVVTGAIDDIGVESVIGFGNMNATANSEEMYGKGIDARFFSRANDRRRGGFVESQGGGTVLLTRGDIALKMGLPVAGVVGFVHSYADGAHTSIPAPGLGALAAGMGGKSSKLVRDLARLGVSADDIAVVSKHDTSTNANDPNESELHNTLAHAIGRSDGNPLFVISQKTLTGHAKGGAAIFQVNGITQLFKSGVVPANASLECVDPKLAGDDLMVWLRKPLDLGARGTVKAALATSLGFGHVSGFVALVHPGAFEAAVAATESPDALEEWRSRANERLAAGQRHLQEGMMGRAALYEPIDNRRFREDRHGYNAHEVEKAMLLDPDARLGASGYFEM